MLAHCRTHPIRTAALIGAIVGVINVLVLETGGLLHYNTRGALLLLAPFLRFGLMPTEQNLLQLALILFIEFAANILADALLFAAPVAVIVLLLRAFRR
jgi:hypothetical protein